MDTINNFIEYTFRDDVRAHFTMARQEGTFFDFPDTLHEDLRGTLVKQGIKQLYEHQVDAFQTISQNKDTLIVSNTASGKTLSFFLPILNEYLHDKQPFSVLLLYPTKALSRDQESTFGSLMEVVNKSGRLGTFDGDTPRDERERIQRNADFIVTNPDMLHSGILPNHNRRWRNFLSRLRYIVVDEVHIYRGAFGSHVSNVFRRLLRICSLHGSSPTFVCSSATVGNPDRLASSLFHRDFMVIQKDTAPRPDREFYFVNPPLVESHGHALYRKGPAAVSIPVMREAAKRKIRTICFCRARQEVERLYRAVTDRHPELAKVIKPYRGGLLPNERRQLERDLSSGKLLVIITTNALELGIDIGDLDLCILSGHPGTVASFWQQSGRVGRKDKAATVLFIARERPIDQFMINHPDFITSAPVEEALLNADNPYILMQHLPCAAQEHPLRESEPHYDDLVYREALALLKEDKTVVPYRETYRYSLQDYPSRGVNLRGMTDYNVEIFCGTEVIGEIDPIGARGTLYRDAIYHHLGRKYMSMDLDLEKKLCRVEPVDADYYTEAVWEGRLDMIEPESTTRHNGGRLEFGYIRVNRQPKLYKKIRERSYENIGYGPITLDPFEYETTGFSIIAPEQWTRPVEGENKLYIGAAYYGLAYIIRYAATVFCMADIKDINTDVSLVECEPGVFKSTLYLYDAIEGGVGYAEKVYENIGQCLEMCRDIINECSCTCGCPSCVPPLPPGVEQGELEQLLIESNASVACTASIVSSLADGKIGIPDVRTTSMPVKTISAPDEDVELKNLQQKLGRASKILKNKRERLH